MRLRHWRRNLLSQKNVTNLAVSNGWQFVEPVAEDGSARRYDRYEKSGKSAILMSVYGDTPGHRLADFVRIGGWLRDVGLSAPEIYEADEAAGELLLEDFGPVSFKDQPNYQLAGDVLAHLSAQGCTLELPHYDDSHVHAGRGLIMRWFVPALRGEVNPDGLIEAYLAVWDEIEVGLPPCPQGFTHIDFHAENLMWLPGREGLQRCGILDFQGAMIGPSPYDLVNLLEDMRADVPADIQNKLLAGRSEEFLAWYRVLGTQLHCRLIGQCVRWAVRDGKPAYMHYMPRLFGYMDRALEDPILSPLRQFFEDQGLRFDQVPALSLDGLRARVQE